MEVVLIFWVVGEGSGYVGSMGVDSLGYFVFGLYYWFVSNDQSGLLSFKWKLFLLTAVSPFLVMIA